MCDDFDGKFIVPKDGGAAGLWIGQVFDATDLSFTAHVVWVQKPEHPRNSVVTIMKERVVEFGSETEAMTHLTSQGAKI